MTGPWRCSTYCLTEDGEKLQAALLGVRVGVLAHTYRFGKVRSRYAHEVIMAHGGDIGAAAAASDEEVAARVAEYEREQGCDPRDWHAIGREERAHDK